MPQDLDKDLDTFLSIMTAAQSPVRESHATSYTALFGEAPQVQLKPSYEEEEDDDEEYDSDYALPSPPARVVSVVYSGKPSLVHLPKQRTGFSSSVSSKRTSTCSDDSKSSAFLRMAHKEENRRNGGIASARDSVSLFHRRADSQNSVINSSPPPPMPKSGGGFFDFAARSRRRSLRSN